MKLDYTREELEIIKIDSSSTPNRQRINLLHELIHGSDSMTSMEADEISEAATTRIARCLWGFFRDNPGLAEWIAKGDT